MEKLIDFIQDLLEKLLHEEGKDDDWSDDWSKIKKLLVKRELYTLLNKAARLLISVPSNKMLEINGQKIAYLEAMILAQCQKIMDNEQKKMADVTIAIPKKK